jgi:type IV pilus assembly protein PilP
MATSPIGAILQAAFRHGRVPLLGACAAGLAVSACLPELPAPKAPPSGAAASTTDATTAVTDDPQAAAYVYSPTGKRDPFRDPASNRVAIPPQSGAPMTPLQRFDIDQLKLTFTNTATATPLAMIIDPPGRSHMVQIGDFVGKNWGKVSSIKREELEITETIADPNTGRVYPVFIPMRMQSTDAEKNSEQAYELRVLPVNP